MFGKTGTDILGMGQRVRRESWGF